MKRSAVIYLVSLGISTSALARPPATPTATPAHVAPKPASRLKQFVLRTENKLLQHLEPPNHSGFAVRPPSSIGVATLNIAETAAVRMHLMRPLKPYSAWVDRGKLMRGSEPSTRGFAELAAQGVHTVINLRLETDAEKATVEHLGMQSVQIPMYDQGLPSHAEVASFLKITMDPKAQPVYIHCEQGVGRTGMFAAFFRIAHDGYSADAAVSEAKAMGMKSSDQEKYIRAFASDYARGGYAPSPSPSR